MLTNTSLSFSNCQFPVTSDIKFPIDLPSVELHISLRKNTEPIFQLITDRCAIVPIALMVSN